MKITNNDELIRLDKYLALKLDKSRTYIKNMFDNNLVKVNNKIEKPSYILKINDEITYELLKEEKLQIEAKNLDLDIVYQDEDIAIINKAKGMIVHPASTAKSSNTLVSGLMYELDNLSQINGIIRPGIVHRIDKDTTGLLVVAKNDYSHVKLQEQLKDHSLKRVYYAIVCGVIKEDKGKIDAPIGRSKTSRTKMEVIADGKEAITFFEVIKRFKEHTLVKVFLQTGRTHQIRVHFSYIGKPILSDPVYGFRKPFDDKGQYLHAKELELIHPRTEKLMHFECELPKYFQDTLEYLNKIS